MSTDLPRRGPRFSLATMLLLMALAALGVTVWQLYRELVPLRAELRRLRDEVGALSIDDDTKLNAIQARTHEEFVWKWRLWIPTGREYALHYASEKIPKQGFPTGQGMITVMTSGETWIEYRIFHDEKSGKWRDKLSMPSASVGSRQQDWVEKLSRVGTSEGAGTTTKEFETGQVALITRQRVSTTATDSSKIEDPSDGFMIWLVPTK